MKGQVSTELMVIVAMILVVFIPLLTLVYFKANDANQEISSYEAELTVFRLAYLSNSVGSLGTDTEVYTDLYVPRNVISLTTEGIQNGGEIVMVLDTAEGNMEIVEIVQHKLSDETLISETDEDYGWSRFKITSTFDTVSGDAFVEIVKEN